jgi:hypothetical protein
VSTPLRSIPNTSFAAQAIAVSIGVILISKGTPVVAQVMRKLHERLGREGKITIRFQSTTAKNGAGVIVGSIFLFPIGLLFLLLQGGD